MPDRGLPDFFRLLKEVLDVGLFLTTPEGVVLDANLAAIRMMGAEPQEVDGAVEVAECYADPAQRLEVLEELERKGVVRRTLRMRRLRTGEPFWARLNLVAVKEGEEVRYIVGTIEDVEEEVRQGELIERRRAVMEAMALSAEELIKFSEPAEFFPRLLERLAKALGADRAFLFRKEGTDGVVLQHQWAAEGTRPLAEVPGIFSLKGWGLGRWAEVFSKGGLIAGQREAFPPRERRLLRLLGLDSALFVPIVAREGWVGFFSLGHTVPGAEWTSEEINALRWAAGVMAAAAERSRMERALERERELFLQTLQDAPYGILLVEGGRHIFANDEFTKITGYGLEDVPTVSQWLRRAFPDRSLREKVRAIWTVEKADTREVLELPVVAKDGSRRWVEFRPSLLPGGQVMVCMADVTPQKEMEWQVRIAQRLEALGELAGGIAHEFNNLLTTVRSFVQIGMAKAAPQEPLRRYLEVIERESKKGAELTRKILAYARRQPLSLHLLDLNEVVRETLEILERTLGEHIRIEVHLSAGLDPVEADPTALEQILMNLALNARDAMPQGGTLTVRTYKRRVGRGTPLVGPGSYVVLEVSDTGVGMDEETAQRIFDPFFTTKEGGTGLGLSVVYGLVKQHRGAITVASELGKGTTFQIFLPRAKKAEGMRREERAEVEPPEGGAGTVLVVEDDPSLRELMREILQEYGYRPFVARDGREALEVLKERAEEIDLVVADLVMPHMGGKELYEWTQGHLPSIPFLFVSGYAPGEELRDFISRRRLPFLSKPFSPSELLGKVREVLDKASSEG